MNIHELSSILHLHSSSPILSVNDIAEERQQLSLRAMEYFGGEFSYSFNPAYNIYKSEIENEVSLYSCVGVYNRTPLQQLDPNSMKCQRIQNTHTENNISFIKTTPSRLLETPISPPNSNNSISFEKSILTSSLPIEGNSTFHKNPRFTGDLYKPTFIRGSGGDREGRCELCNPPIWLNLKRSTYWYHMNFTHGISSKTGAPYPDPVSIRIPQETQKLEHDKRQYIEALCSNCNRWVLLGLWSSQNINGSSDSLFISSERNKLSDWFKHCQKCLAQSPST